MDYCQTITQIYMKSCNNSYVGHTNTLGVWIGATQPLMLKVEELNRSLDKNCLMSIDLINKYCNKNTHSSP